MEKLSAEDFPSVLHTPTLRVDLVSQDSQVSSGHCLRPLAKESFDGSPYAFGNQVLVGY